MCGANHFASEDLKLYIGKLIGRWSRHKDMMGWRKAILEKSIEFHETENKVSVMVMVECVIMVVCDGDGCDGDSEVFDGGCDGE